MRAPASCAMLPAIVLQRAALAVFLLFAANVAVECFDAQCLTADEPACRACLCRTPAAPVPASAAVRLRQPRAPFRFHEAPAPACRLADKSFFQPPKAA